MGTNSIPLLLVTANVGSIFEDPDEMLTIWTQEFLSIIDRFQPKFIALHCQEVGGKNYENSMKHVENFIKLLTTSNQLRLFDKIRIFLDEDYSSAEHFTALGNLYFIHESINDILLYNFNDMKFVPVVGSEINSGNIENVSTKEKAKFPQDFFPECKWSRKGFMRTRWSINNTIIDLVNIHLFHDASNFIAMEQYPSVYCKNRRRALEHTLERFHNDIYGKVPHFIFGDFNFRTDTESVIKKLTEGLTTTRLQNNKNNEFTKLQYATDDSQLVLTVGKKEFNHTEHQKIFLTPPTWLKSFDKELEAFEQYLTEYPINFPPSYPFEEKISHGRNYMQTRCPAWCDRVLLSHTAKQLVDDNQNVEYGLIGLDTCMGDHKPVYLRITLHGNAGIVKCCNHNNECAPNLCQCCQSFASIKINIIDMSDAITTINKNTQKIDSKLLHEPITKDMLQHEPYTPESPESHSPSISQQIDINLNNNNNNNNIDNNGGNSKDKMRRNSSVSASQLKLRLEQILEEQKKRPKKLMIRSASENVQIHNLNENFFRNRAMSELPCKSLYKIKLMTARFSTNSLNRLQSHHSSSDEDWFEINDKNGDRDDHGGDKIDNFDINKSKEDLNETSHNVDKLAKKRPCCCLV